MAEKFENKDRLDGVSSGGNPDKGKGKGKGKGGHGSGTSYHCQEVHFCPYCERDVVKCEHDPGFGDEYRRPNDDD